MRKAVICILILLSISLPALAWGNKGHEVVAYIAYQHLDDATRKDVDELVALNPCFNEWKTAVSALPAAQQSVGIFMLAATWPDKIKSSTFVPPYDCQPDHKFIVDGGIPPGSTTVSPDYPPSTAEASQNIGYGDDRRHQYWHFIDTPFSPDGTSVNPPSTPNALTELMLLAAALHSDEGDDLKSYDMVWVEHLVGDIHQPLHDTTRFTSGHPNGDAGGNDVLICETSGCTTELHGYWDDLPGSGNDLPAAIAMGQQLDAQPAPDDDAIDIEDPPDWVSQGFALAKSKAYAPPISQDSVGSTPKTPGAAYAAQAKETMNAQLFLAGYRLAALLNGYLA